MDGEEHTKTCQHHMDVGEPPEVEAPGKDRGKEQAYQGVFGEFLQQTKKQEGIYGVKKEKGEEVHIYFEIGQVVDQFGYQVAGYFMTIDVS